MKRLNVVCQCVEVISLAVWVGGLVSIIAAVIPAVFGTMGMEAGGRMLTRTFQGYDRLALASAGLVITGTLVRVFVGGPWKTQLGVAERALLPTVVVIAATLAFWLTRDTVRLQGLAL